MYDIIGDIHGNAVKLIRLLKKMGYQYRDCVWRHPTRQVIFVGDFIDRGQQQLETVTIARAMVESGNALAVLGNHELNAIAWHTPHPTKSGQYLRSHPPSELGKKNRHQHLAFLNEVEHLADTHQSIIDWFLTLPLWLDLPEIRVVHACWHPDYIAYLTPQLKDARLPHALLPDATLVPESPSDKNQLSIFKTVEGLCKGIEIPLPDDQVFIDKDGVQRRRVRIRWWDTSAITYRQAVLLPKNQCQQLPDVNIPDQLRVNYPNDKAIFFGHYWMTGTPNVLSDKLACVDYSAGNGNPLIAYRWSGETKLNNAHFIGSD